VSERAMHNATRSAEADAHPLGIRVPRVDLVIERAREEHARVVRVPGYARHSVRVPARARHQRMHRTHTRTRTRAHTSACGECGGAPSLGEEERLDGGPASRVAAKLVQIEHGDASVARPRQQAVAVVVKASEHSRRACTHG
jgi:hypothetical protein